jgi:glycosyltransferase involved in cell wall biosynthesis
MEWWNYRRVKRLLLVSHRPITQEAGPAARWRSFARWLPDLGWQVDVISAAERAGNVEFAGDARSRRLAARRAALMRQVGRASEPVFALAGVRPEAMPLSMAWIPRGSRGIRRRLGAARYNAVVATRPPMAALLAARVGRLAEGPPLVIELRDLWAGNPAFDRGGRLLSALESWTMRQSAAIVACTPEAAKDLRRRHPKLAGRVHEIPNGFEAELLRKRGGNPRPPASGPLTILHSGTVTVDRPLKPLLRVLAREPFRGAFRLVLHGYLAPAALEEVAAFRTRVPVEIEPPSTWADAIDRIAQSDAALVTQSAGAGDATAVASKVYEYLALGKPVLCLTDGGATEGLLTRLDAADLCARLDDEHSIERALERLRQRRIPERVTTERLTPYERRRGAEQMAILLDEISRS